MRVIKSKDGFTNTQDMVGGRERCESEIIIQPPWSRVKRQSEGPTKEPPIYWLCWVLASYSAKICYAGQTKLCLQCNFVAEGNSNYMKDNYDVKLLQ